MAVGGQLAVGALDPPCGPQRRNSGRQAQQQVSFLAVYRLEDPSEAFRVTEQRLSHASVLFQYSGGTVS